MAKRAEKIKFDRHPHVNRVPFILETTGRPQAVLETTIRILQPLTNFVCVPSLFLLDHSWRIGARGGLLHGSPLLAGFQLLAPTARHSGLTCRQQLNSPGVSRRRHLRTRLCPRTPTPLWQRCTQLSPGFFYADPQLGSRRLDPVRSDSHLCPRCLHPSLLDHSVTTSHPLQDALQHSGP